MQFMSQTSLFEATHSLYVYFYLLRHFYFVISSFPSVLPFHFASSFVFPPFHILCSRAHLSMSRTPLFWTTLYFFFSFLRLFFIQYTSFPPSFFPSIFRHFSYLPLPSFSLVSTCHFSDASGPRVWRLTPSCKLPSSFVIWSPNTSSFTAPLFFNLPFRFRLSLLWCISSPWVTSEPFLHAPFSRCMVWKHSVKHHPSASHVLTLAATHSLLHPRLLLA